MIGLIKKDLLLLKNIAKFYVMLLIIYIAMAFMGSMDLAFLLPILSVMVFISTFSYDELNKWNAYAITLPNGPKNVVISKYVATIIMILIIFSILIIVSLLMSTISQDFEFTSLIPALLGNLLASFLYESIMYPVIFKYGIEKARIIIFILIIVLSVVIVFLISEVDFSFLGNLLTGMGNYIYVFISIIMLAFLFISYKLSEFFYLKREF